MSKTDTVYVRDDLETGDHLTYGDWSSSPTEWREHTKPMTLIEYATGSDYSGSLVEQSNYRTLLADLEIAPHLVTISGGHGTFALGYFGGAHGDEYPCDALRDAVAALSDYPLLSDDDHSHLEMETEQEQWASAYGGRHDFRRGLAAWLDEQNPAYEHDADRLTDDQIDRLWRDGCDAFNVNGGSGYSNESGSDIYFHIDRWFKYNDYTPHTLDQMYAKGYYDGPTDYEQIARSVIVPGVDDSLDTTVEVALEIFRRALALLAGQGAKSVTFDPPAQMLAEYPLED